MKSGWQSGQSNSRKWSYNHLNIIIFTTHYHQLYYIIASFWTWFLIEICNQENHHETRVKLDNISLPSWKLIRAELNINNSTKIKLSEFLLSLIIISAYRASGQIFKHGNFNCQQDFRSEFLNSSIKFTSWKWIFNT